MMNTSSKMLFNYMFDQNLDSFDDSDPNKNNIRFRNSLNTDCDVCGTDEDEGLEGGGGAVEGASAPLLASPVQDCVLSVV